MLSPRQPPLQKLIFPVNIQFPKLVTVTVLPLARKETATPYILLCNISALGAETFAGLPASFCLQTDKHPFLYLMMLPSPGISQ